MILGLHETDLQITVALIISLAQKLSWLLGFLRVCSTNPNPNEKLDLLELLTAFMPNGHISIAHVTRCHVIKTVFCSSGKEFYSTSCGMIRNLRPK